MFAIGVRWDRIGWTILGLTWGAAAFAQDAATTLRLRFEGTLAGEAGEAPTQAQSVSYVAGVQGSAARFASGSRLRYARAGNLDGQEGSLEFWIRPEWSGGDGQTYTFASCGAFGGLLFAKDGANNLRMIANRYSAGGAPEADVARNISDWTSGVWRHVAYTWSSSARRLRLYVDGVQVDSESFGFELPALTASDLWIGSDLGNQPAWAALDELRISGRERGADEVAASYLAGVQILSLGADPASLDLLETWHRTPRLTALTDRGPIVLPPAAAAWSTTNAAVAQVAAGRVLAVRAGTATVRATLNGRIADIPVTVRAPVRPPQTLAVPPALASPMPGAESEIPVAILRYLPTPDGVNVDSAASDYFGTVASLRTKIEQMERQVKFMLEEGSRFRGYRDPTAAPALGYRVVAIVDVFEPLPPDRTPGREQGGAFFPDYRQILERFDARRWVEDLGVKQIWLWGYHHGEIVPAESNMSSPTTGDVSNSYRWNDDLPVYDRTYVLYNYNFTRSANEAVHNHGHQLEAILGYAATRQDGHDRFFWHEFAGRNAAGERILGRCGDTHCPPNTLQDYDYVNPVRVPSDIRDWRPGGGPTEPIGASDWAAIPYAWPAGDAPADRREPHWYIFWMQAMPGRENGIRFDRGYTTNWWRYTADWDAAIAQTSAGYGLWSPAVSVRGAIELQDAVSVDESASVELRALGNGRVDRWTVPVQGAGAFELADVQPGRYRLSVHVAGWLRRTVDLVVGPSGVAGLAMSLVNGDIDADNAVTVFDYDRLSAAFDTSAGDPGWDATADLDRDGTVTVFDYDILSRNFDRVGDD